jgi:hypothetical protein
MKSRRPAVIAAGILIALILLSALYVLGRYYVTTTPVSPVTVAPSASQSPTPAASVYPPVISGAAQTWPTEPHIKPFSGTLPPTPQLTAVRLGTHDTYDRIAFDFRQDRAPGYSVQYITRATRDASGAPITLTGGAVLDISFNPADAHDSSGKPTASAPTNPTTTGFPGLESYVMSGDNEGHVTFDLGVSGRTGYRVQELKSGDHWTVYVDVPHP